MIAIVENPFIKTFKNNLSIVGHIRCSKCDKAMRMAICSNCGNSRCHIIIYWHGKHYKFRRYFQDGGFLDHERACRQINIMRSQIDIKTFNPLDWINSTISEKENVNKIYEQLHTKKQTKELTALIYFITFDGQNAPIKIGMTRCETIDRRLEELQAANSNLLIVLATINGHPRVEHALHWLFKADRINNEWFNRSELLLKFIEKAQEIRIADEIFIKLCDEINDFDHIIFHPYTWQKFGLNSRAGYLIQRGISKRKALKAVKRMEQVSIVRHEAMTGRTALEGKPAIPHNVGLIPEGKADNAPGNEMRPSHDRRIINQGDTCRRVV